MRRSEVTDVDLPDLDLARRELTVTGKGRRTRTMKYGAKTAKALDRRLRVCGTDPRAERTAAL